jgi:hypothetical protein
MNRITHSLVGYDRVSERVTEEYDVSDAILPKAKELARVPADDPDAVMCYPLDASGARDLADVLKARIDLERRDYFLEGFAGAGAPYKFADDAEFRADDPPGWSVWIHNDATRDHVKVLVARTTLDEYAHGHGHKDHRAVVDLLNERLRDQVREIVRRAIDGGRATASRLELNGHDLAAMLDG